MAVGLLRGLDRVADSLDETMQISIQKRVQTMLDSRRFDRQHDWA